MSNLCYCNEKIFNKITGSYDIKWIGNINLNRNNECKYFKQITKRFLFWKLKNKKIDIKYCKDCEFYSSDLPTYE